MTPSTEYRERRIAHWDTAALAQNRRPFFSRAYHQRLQEVYRFVVPVGQRVLEVGCGSGELLAAVEPAEGVGIDFAPEMIRSAETRHPKYRFLVGDADQAAEVLRGESFDVVILSDLVNDLWDVQDVLSRMHPLCTPRTRLVLNWYSRVWQPALSLAQLVGFARAQLPQNWLTSHDLRNLLRLASWRPLRGWHEILLPVPVPGIAALFNRLLTRVWPFHHLALANFIVARPKPRPAPRLSQVTVVVPARNEAGNVAGVLSRTPELGSGSELIFVEGHSRDDTHAAIEKAIAQQPGRSSRLLRQTGEGKADAVRLGFEAAAGDILMILDCDLTVAPEDLSRFYEVIRSGEGELINGVRLVYPRKLAAMRFANLVGNKLFGLMVSWLLGQPVRDTLCGTKVLRREDYERLCRHGHHWRDLDPFGDFELLFRAAQLNLEIVDLPIRYVERSYGTTNIARWRHGWLLLRMCVAAAIRLKLY